jgi:hypothetical protein
MSIAEAVLTLMRYGLDTDAPKPVREAILTIDDFVNEKTSVNEDCNDN